MCFSVKPVAGRRSRPVFVDDLQSKFRAVASLLSEPVEPRDLGSQLEELLVEVWRQERFEREHPFTCATVRAAARS